jgi:Niemann-Pick C1 protein
MVMSIGLLVDFVMHILLRYYETPGENRNEKTKETLRTMGSSILLGSLSTFLGVLPLAFSTSEIFTVIFKAFIGLVTLGAGQGLILLPVVLSLIGPLACTRTPKPTTTRENSKEETPSASESRSS